MDLWHLTKVVSPSKRFYDITFARIRNRDFLVKNVWFYCTLGAPHFGDPKIQQKYSIFTQKLRFLRRWRMLSQNLLGGETTLVRCSKSTINIVMKRSQTLKNRIFWKFLGYEKRPPAPSGYHWFVDFVISTVSNK